MEYRGDSTELLAEELESRNSRWVITSGGEKEQVEDGEDNSPFALAIISELRNNKLKKIISDALALRLREITRSNANQRVQNGPLWDAGHAEGRFVFTLREKKT